MTLLAVIILMVSCDRASSIAHENHIEQLDTVNLKHNCVENVFHSIYKFLFSNYNSYNNVDQLLLSVDCYSKILKILIMLWQKLKDIFGKTF